MPSCLQAYQEKAKFQPCESERKRSHQNDLEFFFPVKFPFPITKTVIPAFNPNKLCQTTLKKSHDTGKKRYQCQPGFIASRPLENLSGFSVGTFPGPFKR